MTPALLPAQPGPLCPFGLHVCSGLDAAQARHVAEQRGDTRRQIVISCARLRCSIVSGWPAGFSPLIEHGRLACQRGDYQRALDLLRPRYDQLVQTDAASIGMVALVWQAVCHLELGDLVTATERCRQALVLAIEYPEDIRVGQIAMIVANMAVASGTHIAAARLLGCADSYLASTSYTFEYDQETDWKRLHDPPWPPASPRLARRPSQAAWAAGQALTLKQAMAEALGTMASDRMEGDHCFQRGQWSIES